jgi:hypothetical protein
MGNDADVGERDSMEGRVGSGLLPSGVDDWLSAPLSALRSDGIAAIVGKKAIKGNWQVKNKNTFRLCSAKQIRKFAICVMCDPSSRSKLQATERFAKDLSFGVSRHSDERW